VSAVLRIGTWNVEYADSASTNARRRAVMERCPADIWVLTETHDDLTPGPQFRASHSEQRPFYGNRVRERSRWVSIWTRLPIVTEVRLAHADHERTVVALIQTPLGPLLVYGTVMPWNGDKGRMGSNLSAVGWSEHHRVIPLQIADWRELRRLMPGTPLCVAGDYNSDMQVGAYYGTACGITLLQQGLKEVGLFCATDTSCVAGGWLAHPPIDHIALPEPWKSRVGLASAWEGRVGSPRLSDHSGMVISIGA